MNIDAPGSRKAAEAIIFANYMMHLNGERGWLDYHFMQQTEFARRLIKALALCELRAAGMGVRLATELADIRYTPAAEGEAKWKAGFEQLIQKLAEVVVARTICTYPWPDNAKIECEPENPVTKGRPDFSVTTEECIWLFEVKCPSFFNHQQNRNSRSGQLPIRSPLIDSFGHKRDDLTLPRDNTLKDFLLSAEKKFSEFSDKKTIGILVVAWDLNMYEAIAVLCHPEAGLLTEKSWYKIGDDRVPFDSVSGVLVLNRLHFLAAGAQESLGIEEFDEFQLGGDGSPPNTWCPNMGVGDLEQGLARHFDAWPFEGTAIAADYALLDYVMWFNASRPSQNLRRAQSSMARNGGNLFSSASHIAIACGQI